MGYFNEDCPPGKCPIGMTCNNCSPNNNKKKPAHTQSSKIKSLGGGWYIVNGKKVRGKDKAEDLLNDNS